MTISLEPGKYVVAVSGGVDSMVLLDLLRRKPGVELVVAHFDHGIRGAAESATDRRFVQEAAASYGLPFEYEEGELGAEASEAQARTARYVFLRRVQKQHQADAIITAHHQDDLLETAIINMLRGTGRKGLSALDSGEGIIRPLLLVPKKHILEYAQKNAIQWREDSTNASDQYLRNYIRLHIMSRLDEKDRRQLLGIVTDAILANPLIDQLLLIELQKNTTEDGISRRWFAKLPYSVSCEIMAAWLRSHQIREFDKKTIERLVVGAKVSEPGKRLDINTGHLLKVGKTTFSLQNHSIS